MDYWGETHGGLRGSTLLRLASLIILLGAGLNASLPWLPLDADLLQNVVPRVGWLCWISGLWLMGAGFIWIGINPILSRFGLLVGLIHVVQGLFLLLALFQGLWTNFPPAALSFGRLLLLILFVGVEAREIGRRTALVVGLACGLIIAKISARILGYLGDLTWDMRTVLDSALLALLAVAIWVLASSVRRCERSWAKQQYQDSSAGLNDFNNPQHPWNQ